MGKLNDNIRIFSNKTSKELMKLTANSLKEHSKDLFEKGILNVSTKTFPSGEVYCKLPLNVRKKSVHLIASFHSPDSFELKKSIVNSNLSQKEKAKLIEDFIHTTERDFRELEKICDAARRGGAAGISVYLPYFPDSRQEKKDVSGVPISAKLALDNIKASTEPTLRRLASAELHSPQIQGMTNYPLDEMQVVYLFILHLKLFYSLNDVVLILPDAGSYKRYQGLIKDFQLNYSIISKTRPEHGKSRAENYIGSSLKNKIAVIFDDIIDSGGTIINAAREAKDLGSKDVIVYATHGIFSTKIKRNENKEPEDFIFAEDKFKKEGLKVCISDSVPRTKEYRELNSKWLVQFTLAPLIAELIYCNEKGKSHGEKIEKLKNLALSNDKEETKRELDRFFIY